MAVTHYLVTDATAEEVTRRTGLDAHQTEIGALVERPKPFCLEAELEKLDRLMYPTKIRCTCGKFAVIHNSHCPMWAVMT